jgi:signal peptide peptidase SppA
MKKRRHLANKFQQRLQVHDWAIYEPALAAMVSQLDELRNGAAFNPREMLASVGVSQAMPAELQTVNGVAVIPLVGTVMPTSDWGDEAALDTFTAQFKSAMSNDTITAIVLFVDSPGGSALGVDEVSQMVYAARGTKPVVAFVAGMAASAAFYVASAADKIVSGTSSLTGSIGVVSVHLSYAEMLKNYGMKPTVTTYGKNKAVGNPYENLSDSSRAVIQDRVNAYGRMFDAAVARNRGVSTADVAAKFGQGKVFVGAEAKAIGLVDEIGSFDSAVSLALSMAGKTIQKNKSISLEVANGWRFSLSDQSSNVQSSELQKGESSDSKVTQQPAAVSSGEQNQPQQRNETMKRIAAALFAKGLIASVDATDEQINLAVNAYFAGRGQARPTDEQAVVDALLGNVNTQAIAAAAAPLKTNADLQAARDRELDEARAETAKNERARMADIKARGELLGIDAAGIDAAIQSGKPIGEILKDWTAKKAGEERPVVVGAIRETGAQNFAADALLGLQSRLGCQGVNIGSNAGAQRLSSAPLHELARLSLEASGVRVETYDREEIARAAMGMAGYERQVVRMDAGGYNRPGNFPNILSGLANKIMDDSILLANAMYGEWTGEYMGDLPDFKPAPIVNRSQVDQLDEVLDAQAFKEFGLAEEMLSYLQLSRYGNKFALTPVMVANDDLNQFSENMIGFARGVENTTNRLCLSLITNNATLLDSYALYDNTNHGNLVSSGSSPAAAAPSVPQWDAMQQKVFAQRDIGGAGYVDTPMGVVLVPPALFNTAQQVFGTFAVIGETKVPITDATLNVFRGTATVVREAQLQASSSTIWYGFVNPKIRPTVIRAYFRGWGKNGKRERWYDPNTGCWYFSVEHRVGAAIKNYRYTVRNNGA